MSGRVAPPKAREPRRVAVLGATGCVGSSVCEAFAGAGDEVLAVARTLTPQVSSHPFVPFDAATAPPERIAEVLTAAGVQVVVNAAGGWLATEEANEHHHVRLVENLIDAAALMRHPPRIVQIGSVHEYGPVPPGTTIDESIEPRPLTAYARTKLASSRAVLAANRAGRVRGVVLRAVNVCGPRVTPASFLGSVLDKLRNASPGEAVELSVGEARRDFVDVRDLATAVVKAAEAPVAGQVINIGRGEAVAIRRILSLLLTAAGFPPDTVREVGGRVESRGSDWTLADIRLAERVLGWRPSISLRDSIRDMWEESRSH